MWDLVDSDARRVLLEVEIMMGAFKSAADAAKAAGPAGFDRVTETIQQLPEPLDFLLGWFARIVQLFVGGPAAAAVPANVGAIQVAIIANMSEVEQLIGYLGGPTRPPNLSDNDIEERILFLALNTRAQAQLLTE